MRPDDTHLMLSTPTGATDTGDLTGSGSRIIKSDARSDFTVLLGMGSPILNQIVPVDISYNWSELIPVNHLIDFS